MSKLIKQAFTLIELLVVIAIIGILSGLIVVSMGGMTTKANIAKSQIFSNSLRNALMLDLVSEWKLDDITGGVTLDSWNGGNTGTVGGAPQLQTTGCVSDKCLYFNGTTDYVAGSLNGINSTKRWTISSWLKTVDTNGLVFDTRTSSDNGVFFYEESANYWRFYIRKGAVLYKDYYYALSISENAWHYIIITRDGDNSATLYIDGVAKSPTTVSVNTDMSNISETWSNFALAVFHQFGQYFLSGYFDEVRLYKNGVPVSQIKEQYYAGLNSLLANGNINAGEYSERINSIAQK